MTKNEKWEAVGWLTRNDAEQVVSSRPWGLRIMGIFFSSLFSGMFWMLARNLGSDGTSSPNSVQTWLLQAAVSVAFGLPTVLFFLGSGSRRLCLNRREGRYTITQGWPPLGRTISGTIQGSQIYVYRAKYGFHVRFQAPGWRWGTTLETYETEREAYEHAYRWGNLFDIRVARRDEVRVHVKR